MNGVWITHIALLFGALAIIIGLANSTVSQLNVFGFLAFAVVILSVVGIVVGLWRIERRSIRLRSPLFWYCMLVNVGLLVAMCGLYLRIQVAPATPKVEIAPLAPPESP